MRVMSWNVRSWYRDIKGGDRNWKKRANRIREFIAGCNPDVICLQEALAPMTGKCIPDGYHKATGLSISHHVYVRKDIDVLWRKYTTHWASAVIRHDAKRYQITSVHGHWDKGITDDVCKGILVNAIIGETNRIAVGDWNVSPGEIASRMLYPYVHISTDGEPTFRNWKNGNDGCIDFAAGCYRLRQIGTMPLDWAMIYSDHKPVMYEM